MAWLLTCVGLWAVYCGLRWLIFSIWLRFDLSRLKAYFGWRGDVDCVLADKTTWIVVTGCTDGIGKAMIQRIAVRWKRNPILLCGRSQEKLQRLRDELVATRDGKVESVELDFGTLNWTAQFAAKMDEMGVTKTDISQIEHGTVPELVRDRKTTASSKIGLLINVAGQSYNGAKWFDLCEGEFIERLTRINLRALMVMCRMCIPSMTELEGLNPLKGSSRAKGVIVNVGSATVVCQEPLNSVYVASKSGVRAFSLALQSEYRELGLCVQCQEPAAVLTKLVAKIYHSTDFHAVTPEDYADYAVRCLSNVTRNFVPGLGYFPCVVSPHPLHQLMCVAGNNVPTIFLNQFRKAFRIKQLD